MALIMVNRSGALEMSMLCRSARRRISGVLICLSSWPNLSFFKRQFLSFANVTALFLGNHRYICSEIRPRKRHPNGRTIALRRPATSWQVAGPARGMTGKGTGGCDAFLLGKRKSARV
jgi:hypothetical protein